MAYAFIEMIATSIELRKTGHQEKMWNIDKPPNFISEIYYINRQNTQNKFGQNEGEKKEIDPVLLLISKKVKLN